MQVKAYHDGVDKEDDDDDDDEEDKDDDDHHHHIKAMMMKMTLTNDRNDVSGTFIKEPKGLLIAAQNLVRNVLLICRTPPWLLIPSSYLPKILSPDDGGQKCSDTMIDRTSQKSYHQMTGAPKSVLTLTLTQTAKLGLRRDTARIQGHHS